MTTRRIVGWAALAAVGVMGGCSQGAPMSAGGNAPPASQGIGAPGLGTWAAQDDIRFGSAANPYGVPFETFPEPASTGTSGDSGIVFRGQDINLTPSNFTPPNAPDLRRDAPSPRPATWKRSGLAAHTSRLSIGDEEALPLEATQVSVRVEGFRARVVLDLFFRNDRDRILEGAFQLRLPDGASPHYLAFGETKWEKPDFTESVPVSLASIREERAESWAAPREARMVPREKAAFAYGDTVRKKVDPALLEWSGAGVFSARIFPLAPKKLHRVVVAYDVDLVPVGDDLVYRLDLPREAGALDVELDVAGGEAEVAPAGERREGRWHWRDPALRTITARLPHHRSVVIEGEEADTGRHFAAQLRPDVPEAPGRARDRAVFLVDVSLSANPDAFNVWLALLRSVLEKNRPDLREFAVAFFNVETFWWSQGFRANSPENVEALATYARSLTLEGATDLGQAFAAVRALPGEYDLFLLGDGSVTWGEGDPHALSRDLGSGHALFAYATGVDRGG